MSLLDRKLVREIGRMKGQCTAIAVLIAMAVGVFVGAASTHRSLQRSRDGYYCEQRFGDVFVEVARAPAAAAERLRRINGVEAIQVRLAANGVLSLPGFDEPASARIVGLPALGVPELGRVHLRRGRLPEPGPTIEAVVSEALAKAQHLSPGDHLSVVVDGHRLPLTIVGIGLSPEHVYEVRPGEMFPDNRRFGVLWVPQAALEEALGMGGAFNEVVLKLGHGAVEEEVIASADRILAPYGGLGAYGRNLHVSARFLADELKQLESTAFFIPTVFLAVAVFLLNVIVGRVIATQREQIATLKALGFGNGIIGLHYLQLTVLVVTAGSIIGIAVGYAFGSAMIRAYAEYYRFPRFDYAITAGDVLIAVGMSLVASIAGTLGAVRRAVLLRPAEAMRPATPAVFRSSVLERLGFDRLLSIPGRMVLRNLSRRPLRAIASSIGIAFAVALLVTGLFFSDAMDAIVDSQFRRSQRQDLTVAFDRPVAAGALYEIEAIPGVRKAEPLRTVGANLRHGHRSYRTAVTGLPTRSSLQRVLSIQGEVLEVPPHGLLLSETLARNIGARVGDPVEVELLESRRNTVTTTVSAIVDEPFGTSAYASLETANALAGTGPLITSALLQVDDGDEAAVFGELGKLPSVLVVTSRKAMLRSFDEMTEEVLLFFAGALALFAGAMALGVVYNAARVSLSERERELATMRVIGLTRAEISGVLLGELFVMVVAALPIGCVFGWAFARATAISASTEMYRIPFVISPTTYLFAMTVVLSASVVAALVVRRRLDGLDLVSVLKTKE